MRDHANATLISNPLTDENVTEKLELLCKSIGNVPTHTPTDCLSMFMSQALNSDRYYQKAVDDLFMRRQGAGFSLINTNTQAYHRARQRLPTEMVGELVRYSGNELTARFPDSGNGRSEM